MVTNMELKHYGTPKKSGRYPWGSGEDPQHNRTFSSQVKEMRKLGLSDVEICKSFGIKTGELREKYSYEINALKEDNRAQCRKLKAHGWSYMQIERKTGIPESTIRGLLKDGEAAIF